MKTYDEIQENYGVLNCGQRIFDALDREDIEAYRKEAYGYRVLVYDERTVWVFADRSAAVPYHGKYIAADDSRAG